SAEVSCEDIQRAIACGRVWNDERIMVSRNRENWTRIVPKGIVKLIVVILRLSEVINDVSQVIKKCGSIRGIGRPAIVCHLIGYASLVSVLSFVRRTSVASGVEDNLSSGLDSSYDLRAVRTKGRFEFVEPVRCNARWIESYNLLL